jgi:hypothetical protein
MIRLICFVSALASSLFLPWWCFVGIAFVYALLYTPYELLVVGVVIDASFGEVGRGFWYSYTMVGIVSILFAYVVRPLIRL